MGNAPSSSRSSTPPSSPPAPPRVPPRVHSPPPRDALALMRGQSLTSKAQPTPPASHPSPIPATPAKSLPSPILSTPKPQNGEIQPPTPKSEAPVARELLPEQDVGEAKPAELEGSSEEVRTSHRTDWAAARAAMERAVSSLRDRAEEIARETMERRREQRAMEEEEARALHERKMTIYEDAEPGLFDELRFPPGLERGGSESEASAMFHSSEPTTDTLVEEPEQVTSEPDEEVDLNELLEKLQVQEVQEEVAVVVHEGPASVTELAALPDEPFAPEPSQISCEEPAKEFAKIVEEAEEEDTEEAEAPQEAMPIVQEPPIITEDNSPDQVPLVSTEAPSERPASLLEEASDTQSDHLTSSVEFPRPDTPHPTFDDTRAASPVPFPVASEPEDQGYSTQDDEDRVSQNSSRAAGKHVHWGGVEAQPAYTRPQEEEEHVEEQPSPPFSRLLLPAPAPAPPVEPPRDLRAERAARLAAARRLIPPTAQKPASRKLEPGLYTTTDVRWGMALDLSGADNRSLIAFGSHGWENQQWEFQSCGSGFIIKSVSAGLFLALEDLQGLHRDGNTEVVAGHFPMCWEMEIMDNGSADNEEDGDGDVYARIRLPHTEMALGFNGGYAGAQLFLTKDANNMSTYWRLRAPRREQVVKNPPISTTESIRQGGMTTLITTTSVTTTTTRTMTRIVTSDA